MGMAGLVVIVKLISAITIGAFMAVAVWLCFKRVNTIIIFCLIWLSSIILIYIFIELK